MVLVEDALNVNIKQIRAIKLVIMINTIRETLKKSDFLLIINLCPNDKYYSLYIQNFLY